MCVWGWWCLEAVFREEKEEKGQQKCQIVKKKDMPDGPISEICDCFSQGQQGSHNKVT